MTDSVILILADGARFDVFEELLAAGELPRINRHIIQRGGYRRMTTVFTSTTGPAYVPFMTGCFPGTVNVPGIRWFDKKAYATKSFLNPHRFRSYCGWEGFFMNRDLHPDIPTIFELVPDAVNIFGPISRGAARGNNPGKRRKAYHISRAHSNGRYEPVDELGLRVMTQTLDRPSRFRFLALPGIDGISHNTHPRHERTIEAYRFVDRAVGKIAERLQADGSYDRTALAICSDHGLSPTHTHFDVPVFMEESLGLSTLYYTNIFRLNPVASAHVSGNGMVHLYFKNGNWLDPCYDEHLATGKMDLLKIFLENPAVDLTICRTRDGWLRIDSRRGRAKLREHDKMIDYRVESGDPFGWPALPPSMSFDEALRLTFDTDYPDALVQIAQIFRSQRCGDLILSATPGYDLRFKWESPEHKSSHGSLHRDHMMTPYCMSLPMAERPMRSVDVFASVLQHLKRDAPDRLDGKSFLY